MIFPLLGEGSNFTVVDTPGFGDSKGPTIENDLIDGMLNFLKETVKEANAIVLLLNGKQERFQYAFQQTIRYKLYYVIVIWKLFRFKTKYFSEKWKLCLVNHFGISQLLQ